MRYFECKAKLNEEVQARTARADEICNDVAARCDEYCVNNRDKFSACVTYLKGKDCVFVISGNGNNAVFDAEIDSFWNLLALDGEIEKKNEVSVGRVAKALKYSRHVDAPEDIEELMKISAFRYSDLDDFIANDESLPGLADYAKKRHMNVLAEEAERIRSCTSEKFIGHPVHYIIEGDSVDKVKKTVEVLVAELEKANRLESCRIACIDETKVMRGRGDYVGKVYENLRGGTVLVSVNTSRGEDEYADATDMLIEDVCRRAIEYRNDVLTIFNISRNDIMAEKAIVTYLKGELTMVECREFALSRRESIAYMEELAANKGMPVTEKLTESLDPETDTFYISELDMAFNACFDDYIRNTVFPAYAGCTKPEVKKTGAEGKAADELAEMIGLAGVKEMISKSVDYFKLQQAYKERNIIIDNPARSMIFTGNPGTAKTTVARLTARIFRENGLLDRGKLVEVGRSDLVGKFVGWTAPTVKEAFRRAKGSILFIDEAYSLVDDRNGSFGDEAINTIVQEMENHRDDTIVIFAGYPDEMEKFLEKNPGLRSRIAFHVNFPDYSEDELLDILRLMVKNKNLRLAGDAADRAGEIFREAVKVHDFGNGRFVRNLLENAMMSMSQRLVEKNLSKISDRQLVTLKADDFRMPVLTARKETKTRRIGF